MSEPPATGGRLLTARYAFAGAAEELARTLPLVTGEAVLEHGAVRLSGVGRPRIVVRWRDGSGAEHDLRMTAWNGRAALDRPIRDVDALADTLDAWLAGAP